MCCDVVCCIVIMREITCHLTFRFCLVLCCAVLCCVVLCCAVLCCAVLCCAVVCDGAVTTFVSVCVVPVVTSEILDASTQYTLQALALVFATFTVMMVCAASAFASLPLHMHMLLSSLSSLTTNHM